MQDIINPVQNISYTNKDFESIYTELLDLVKTLTFKWDPSISNESDPGVILLKLNAIIADKCNYNLDKNVLECFPLSVTQESNARQLFEQLGYYMKWYKSATTDVVLKWIDDTASYQQTGSLKQYVIPPFTMVSDAAGEIIYTLLGPAQTSSTPLVGRQLLSNDGTSIKFNAIQGVAVNYDIDGETVITSAHLDSNNRIYFTNTNVAYNGIFITNTGADNYSSWIRKDNLLVESLGNTYYKFGVSQNGETCYIEFPQDAETIFQEGIEITYVRTNGEYGNIASTQLEKFYNDISAYQYDTTTGTVGTETQLLNSDNVKVVNYFSAIDGGDPESISDAYSGYKKTVGTFDTLITLRDYINAILSSGVLASNGFVCDRANDVQTSYNIMTHSNDVDQRVLMQESKLGESQTGTVEIAGTSMTATYTPYVPAMSAFDLKLYLLQYTGATQITSSSVYDATFYPLRNGEYDTDGKLQDSDVELVKAYIADSKAIAHDYSIFKHSFCFFKNKYPVICTVVPQYTLTDAQKLEVKNNICTALYTALNSTKLSFGDEVEFDVVYQTILNADSRIKSVSLNNIDYTIYAVWWDGTSFSEVPVSTEGEALEFTYNSTATTGKVKVSSYNYFQYALGITSPTDTSALDSTFTYEDGAWTVSEYEMTFSTEDLAEYFGLNITYTTLTDGAEFTVTVSKNKRVREEVYAKCILAGVTQMFVQDDSFGYKLSQFNPHYCSNIVKLASNVNLIWKYQGSVLKRTLQENQSLQLYSPNLIERASYSDYVKFEYHIDANTVIPANSTYTLGSNEYIIFYWRSTSDSSAIYDYYLYGPGNIIQPTMQITGYTGAIKGNSLVPSSWANVRNIGTTTNPIYVKCSSVEGAMSYETSDAIAAITQGDVSGHILSGTDTVAIKYINSVELEGSTLCYWITSDVVTNNNTDYYRLFTAPPVYDSSTTYNVGDVVTYSNVIYKCITTTTGTWNADHWSTTDVRQTRVLGSEEYFIYTDSSMTDMAILGSGSSISRKASADDWNVIAISKSSIFDTGVDVLNSYWKTLTTDNAVVATENQFITLNKGCKITASIIASNPYEMYTMSITKKSGTTYTYSTDLVVTSASTWMSDSNRRSIGTYDLTYDGTNWKDGTTVISLSDYGLAVASGVTISANTTYTIQVENNWVLTFSSTGGKITQTISYGPTGTTPIYSQVRLPQLSDFKLSYIDPSSSSDTSTNVFLSNWTGRSLLSLDISNTQSQALKLNESITYTQLDGTSTTIDGANMTSESGSNPSGYWPVVIMASSAITTDGSQTVSTISTDSSGDTTYLTIYWYSDYANFNPAITNKTYMSDGSVEIKLNSTTSSDSFYIQPSLYNRYIFPCKVTGLSSGCSVSVSYGDTLLYLLGGTGQYITSDSRGYYDLDFSGTSTSSNVYQEYDSTETYAVGDVVIHDEMYYECKTTISSPEAWNSAHWQDYTTEPKTSLTVNLTHPSSQSGDVTITFEGIYKYDVPTGMTSLEYEWMKKLLVAYQYNRIKDTYTTYSYTYTVPEEDLIEDPLSPNAFLNTTHIFNSATICQLNVSSLSDGITIVGKR